jgi:hypothetical protein
LQVRTDGATVTWVDKVLAAQPTLAASIDAYSIHPYPYPRQQGPLVEHSDKRWDYGRVSLIRDLTVAANAAKPMWITEIGWSTANTSDSVSESTQAQFLADAMTRAFTEWPYVAKVFPYTWTKDTTDMTNREAHYGFRRADGSWKPSWAAIKDVIAASGPLTLSAPVESTTTSSTTTSTTVATSPISLTANAYVQRGKLKVDLTWSGVATRYVTIKRDGTAIATTKNDGKHTDSPRVAKILSYVVCDTTGTCSSTVSVPVPI